MIKKYFVCSDTNYIENYIRPINVNFNYSGNSREDPAYNLTFNYEFTEDFFKHVFFYEIYFNEKRNPIKLYPIKLHLLGNNSEEIEFSNGWNDFSRYITKANCNHFFLKNNDGDYWFCGNDELFSKLLEWAHEAAEQQIKQKIIDFLEYGE